MLKRNIHPKAAGGLGGGGLGSAIVSILVASGIPVSGVEGAGISAICAFSVSWLMPPSPAEQLETLRAQVRNAGLTPAA